MTCADGRVRSGALPFQQTDSVRGCSGGSASVNPRLRCGAWQCSVEGTEAFAPLCARAVGRHDAELRGEAHRAEMSATVALSNTWSRDADAHGKSGTRKHCLD